MESKYLWLSTLRGIAIILVYISHIHFGEQYRNLLFIIGRIGVVLFLLMAGYLAYNSVQRKTRKQFFLNRFFRIYPMYWILLLMMYVLHPQWYSIIDLLKNITLFNEYMGAACIIGSSWMLSIMIVFFVILCSIKNTLKKSIPLIYIVLSIGAIFCSVARYIKGIPFPTAFFLLQMIGFIGCISKESGQPFSKKELYYIIAFEVILVITTPLSYSNWQSYIIAYNLGIGCFYIFKNYSIYNKLIDSFSTLGFTFFLGAQIPINAIILIYPPLRSFPFFIIMLITFFSTLLFSYLMTKYIENPILRWGKMISGELSVEKKMNISKIN